MCKFCTLLTIASPMLAPGNSVPFRPLTGFPVVAAVDAAVVLLLVAVVLSVVAVLAVAVAVCIAFTHCLRALLRSVVATYSTCFDHSYTSAACTYKLMLYIELSCNCADHVHGGTIEGVAEFAEQRLSA
jgi:hypothetical protein